MKKEKGFTLVELLIVVAIIGILAAIAIPQFNKYKVKSYVAALRADLKNAYTASQAYLTDYPGATVSSGASLQRGGYKFSANVTATSVNITASAGEIILKHAALDSTNSTKTGTLNDGEGSVNSEGTILVPTPK